jgi:hypothetical protein
MSSLVTSIEAKLGTIGAEFKKIFTAAEPELQSLAKTEGAKLLAALATELPKLEPLLVAQLGTIAGLPPGVGPAVATALVGSIQTWLGTTLAKVAPAIPASPTPTAPAVPLAPTSAAPAKTKP